MAHGEQHLAVLIDGDNVSSKIVDGLLAEVIKYGTVSVRRVYGDWTNPYSKSWRECLLQHSIVPIQQFAYTTGKNATDGMMIIDAMDLLYTGRFTGFCLVSSDSDFTRLAARIREQGLTVYGFGNRNNTHRAFVAACNEFVYFDAFSTPQQAEQLDPAHFASSLRIDEGSTEPFDSSELRLSSSKSWSSPHVERQPKSKLISKTATEAIRAVISSVNAYEEDYVNLADVGNLLVRISPDFTARNNGYTQLSDWVRASGIVDLKMKHRPNGAPIALVRLKKEETLQQSSPTV